MRRSGLLCPRLCLAALLVWARCGAGGGEERHQPSLTTGTGDGRGYSSTPLAQCTYTFILPEMAGATQSRCPDQGPQELGSSNSLLGDALQGAQVPVGQRIQHLELAMENYTHWIQLIEGSVRNNANVEARRLEHSTVNEDTAAILDLSTNLLYQTAKHTRKLMEVETQVLDQTSKLEIQLLENSLTKNKLETQLLQQTNEITKLIDQNGVVERRLRDMESQHQQQLQALREERSGLQRVVLQQSQLTEELQSHVRLVTSNNSLLQSQQQQLREAIRRLLEVCSKDKEASNSLQQADEQRTFRDCADLFHSGFNKSGVYTIHLTIQYTAKVYCDMDTAGGGWTMIQRRQDGTTDFHRSWKEYKMGFGTVSGEHWLGNELVFLLTSQGQYSLRVELTDWNDQQAFSQYEQFHISNEKQKYRLSVKGYSGTAGRLSSLVSRGADFSTKDVDNDNCICQCAPLLTGGWWFDACGASNLNGVYYRQGQHMGKLNGIKWHYFKGPSYSLHKTTMMIRPLDFGDSVRGLKIGHDASE
ncbi:angiopoietin-1-like isoform X2 [Alosa alosa]|uniref:angiopoietin-1-like isoform X2 n=1 Tax=Alosa alosa TaxID=278164 RepID=UPI002015143C|nr:angiopoietin-1-like isoform X2 [Alosa alosa]